MRPILRVVAVAVAGVVLAGCSQIAALKPVSGDSESTVRNAVINVLVDQKVAILVAPVCVAAGSDFTCTGSTVDGKPIDGKATGTSPYDMTVSVDGKVIFTGNAEDVLDRAAQVAS